MSIYCEKSESWLCLGTSECEHGDGSDLADVYVSEDGTEYIPVTTLNKMERNASQYGWRFAFSDNRATVVVTWSEDVVTTYQLTWE